MLGEFYSVEIQRWNLLRLRSWEEGRRSPPQSPRPYPIELATARTLLPRDVFLPLRASFFAGGLC